MGINYSNQKSWENNRLTFMILALLISFLSIYPSFENGWVNWDDPFYVTQNSIIRDISWSGISNMFDPANKVLDTYTPLTLVSFAIDYAFYQDDAGGFHATNIFLHLINVLLVFLLVFKLTKQNSIAFFVAVFFGIHPMHIESIVWISERKDLLFSFFFLASCITYISYLRYSGVQKQLKFTFYGISALFAIMALLAKPQAISLPLVLLLIDYWEKSSFKKVSIVPIIPFFIFSFLVGLMALYFMDDNTFGYSIFEQIILSGHACSIYLVKAILPFGLNHNPGMPLAGEIPWFYSLTTIFSVLFLLLAAWFGRKNRMVIFGIGFFCVTLIFSLHLLKINSGIAYERFTYLPYIGLSIAFAGFLELYRQKYKLNKEVVFGLIVSFIFLFVFLSNKRSGVWKNDEALWTQSIEKQPNEAIGWCKRARYYTSIGLFEKALADQEKCVELSAAKSNALVNRGNIYKGVGNIDAAITDYSEAIKQAPENDLAYACRGVLLIQLGSSGQGIADLKRSVELNEEVSTYRLNLGLAYEINNDFELAMKHYSYAIDINPNDYLAWKYRGSLAFLIGNLDLAISDLEKAVSLRPNFGDAWYTLSKANLQLNKTDLAKKQLEKAIELGVNVEENYKQKFNF